MFQKLISSRNGYTYLRLVRANLRFYASPANFGYLFAFTVLTVLHLQMSDASYFSIMPLPVKLEMAAFYLFVHVLAALFLLPITLTITSKQSLIFAAFVILSVFATAAATWLRYLIIDWKPQEIITLEVFIVSFTGPLPIVVGAWVFFYFLSREIYIKELGEIEGHFQNPESTSNRSARSSNMLSVEPFENVLIVSASKNYTIITTSIGERIIRVPFTQAVKDATTPGIQIHRSHWVANSELKRLFYENGNPKLETVSGTVLPVSRNAVSLIREVLAAEEY